MGRNSIPKLGEWREGKLYSVHAIEKPESPAQPDDGRMVVYEWITAESREVLSAFHADGFAECVAAAWRDGYNKGVLAGAHRAKQEIRAALGLKEGAAP
jgi:hypothetical protein